MSSSSTSKGESHRIYWQQWPSSSKSASTLSRRDLITSSAAIRISSNGARAHDVTQLLCETLNLKQQKNSTQETSSSDGAGNDDADTESLNNQTDSSTTPSWDVVQDAWEQDCLVLVGTLYYLPLQYVRFEHERLNNSASAATTNSNNNNDGEEVSVRYNSSGSRPTAAFTRSDPPFHVIKTLSPNDNPTEQRNRMMEHLKKVLEESAAAFASTNGARRATSVSPKLQWYFCPGSNHPSSPIPSYIDLDGYCTSLEEDEEEEDPEDEESDSETDEQDDQGKQHQSQQELLAKTEENNHPTEKNSNSDSNNDDAPTNNKENTEQMSLKDRIFKKERQRYFELSLCQASLQHDCVSGYLLKQSIADPHVWKRVHCVLTDEHLWYISRIHTRLDTESEDADATATSTTADPTLADQSEEEEEKKQQSPAQPEFYSYAKHRRLGLTRALLVQPSKEKPKSPLFRTPFAFEVIDATGVPHRFRASSLDNYKRWVSALASRIVQSYENSLLEHAELIVRDETTARNKRLMSVAVEPLWEQHQSRQLHNSQRTHKRDNPIPPRHLPMDDPTLKILRFGLEVTEYRERCRHIQAILPAKYPVLAFTENSTPELKRNGSGSGQSVSSSSSSNGAFRLDSKTQALIKNAWDEAVRLGSSATKLAIALQTPPPGSTSATTSSATAATKMPRCLETICQHLEYVITGNFRGALGGKSPSNGNAKQAAKPDNTRQYPPPTDLFDQLLAELQSVAAVASAKNREASAQQLQQRHPSQHSPTSSANHGRRHVIMNGSSHAATTNAKK